MKTLSALKSWTHDLASRIDVQSNGYQHYKTAADIRRDRIEIVQRCLELFHPDGDHVQIGMRHSLRLAMDRMPEGDSDADFHTALRVLYQQMALGDTVRRILEMGGWSDDTACSGDNWIGFRVAPVPELKQVKVGTNTNEWKLAPIPSLGVYPPAPTTDWKQRDDYMKLFRTGGVTTMAMVDTNSAKQKPVGFYCFEKHLCTERRTEEELFGDRKVRFPKWTVDLEETRLLRFGWAPQYRMPATLALAKRFLADGADHAVKIHVK
jgi:hypothetical protein